MVRSGWLTPVLPGVYAESDLAEHPDTRIRAVGLWSGSAVLTGTAAARLTFWPDVEVGPVTVANTSSRCAAHGYRMSRRRVPPHLIHSIDNLRCTSPALTALDLVPTHGTDVLDTALRSRRVTLSQLRETLSSTKGRVGNSHRAAAVLDSRDNPWSPAEREAHRLLRSGGITGWVANYPLPMLGVIYYLDIAFPSARVAVEVDGRVHNRDLVFESDRYRQNDIIMAGWRVLRFTWTMLTRYPMVVLATIRRALEHQAG